MTPRRNRWSVRDAGFTLLEVIVAAGILALIAVFSWRGLDALIRERDAITASQTAIDMLQRSFARIERDALLATDAQVDATGTLRLVAGAASANTTVDGAVGPSVEYQLVSGQLVRRVVGVDVAPLAMLDGVATLVIEAWLPAPGGGAWVRSKGAATEAPRPATAASTNGTGASTPLDASAGTNPNANANANPNAAAPLRSSGAPNVPGVARGSLQSPLPIVAAATGVRFAFARADGSRVLRTFMVGGG